MSRFPSKVAAIQGKKSVWPAIPPLLLEEDIMIIVQLKFFVKDLFLQ